MYFGNYSILSSLPGEKKIWEKTGEVLELLPTLPLGRTDIIPGVMYVNKEEYSSKDPALLRPEVHHRFIDVQTVLQNMELVRCYLPKDLAVDTTYDEAKDLGFYKAGAVACQSGILDPGHIAVIPPFEAHASQMWVFEGETLPIVKAVIKVAVNSVMENWV